MMLVGVIISTPEGYHEYTGEYLEYIGDTMSTPWDFGTNEKKLRLNFGTSRSPTFSCWYSVHFALWNKNEVLTEFE